MKIYVPTGSSVGASLSAQQKELTRPHKVVKLGEDSRRIPIHEAGEYDWTTHDSFIDRHVRYQEGVECPAYYVPTLAYLFRQTQYKCVHYQKVFRKVALHVWLRMGGDNFKPYPQLRSGMGVLSPADMESLPESEGLDFDFHLIHPEILYVDGMTGVRIVSDGQEGLLIAQLMCLLLADPQLLQLGCILESFLDGVRLEVHDGFVCQPNSLMGQLHLGLETSAIFQAEG